MMRCSLKIFSIIIIIFHLSSSLFFYHHHYSLSGPKLLSKNYYHHYLLSKPRWWGVYWREEKITVQVSEKTSIQLWNPQIRGCQFQFSMTRCWVSPLSFEETNRKKITQTKTGKRPKTMTKRNIRLLISIHHDSTMSKPSQFWRDYLKDNYKDKKKAKDNDKVKGNYELVNFNLSWLPDE